VDPEDFFKQSFGGDRFVDIIGEISIGKDMREALETAEDDDHELSPEEKAEREVQKVENEQERNLVRAKRIQVLCEKLIHKLNLYNTHGEKEFVKLIQKEADDLKLENHGVELLHAIGYVYNMKANHYSSKKSVFGLGGMYYSIREKSYIFSQTVGTLRTAYDLQSTFGELQKAEEKGLSDEERAKLEEAAATKVCILDNLFWIMIDMKCRAWKLFGEDPSWKSKAYCVMFVMKCLMIPNVVKQKLPIVSMR
jgi:hypothetical protein